MANSAPRGGWGAVGREAARDPADRVLALCEAAGIQRFDTRWFAGGTLTRAVSGALLLTVPDDLNRTWIQKHYATQLAAAALARGERLVITGLRQAEPRSRA
jgi:hypothetical protein